MIINNLIISHLTPAHIATLFILIAILSIEHLLLIKLVERKAKYFSNYRVLEVVSETIRPVRFLRLFVAKILIISILFLIITNGVYGVKKHDERDAFIFIDSSTSMSRAMGKESAFDIAKDVVIQLIDNSKRDRAITVYRFAEHHELISQNEKNHKSIISSVERMEINYSHSDTDIHKAIEEAVTEKSEKNSSIYVLTDELPEYNRTKKMLNDQTEADMTFFLIGEPKEEQGVEKNNFRISEFEQINIHSFSAENMSATHLNLEKSFFEQTQFQTHKYVIGLIVLIIMIVIEFFTVRTLIGP